MANGQKKRGQDKDPISTEVHTFKTSGNAAAQMRKDVPRLTRRKSGHVRGSDASFDQETRVIDETAFGCSLRFDGSVAYVNGLSARW
jgi:hypothetical protein